MSKAVLGIETKGTNPAWGVTGRAWRRNHLNQVLSKELAMHDRRGVFLASALVLRDPQLPSSCSVYAGGWESSER